MESKLTHITNRVYEDFDPVCKLRIDEARDTIELHLPGFKREQIRIQINHLRMMIISGERPLLDGTKWKRFKKEIKLPPFCNEDAIHGSFMQNILTVVMPKKIPQSYREEEEEQEEFEPAMKKKKDKGKEKVTFEEEDKVSEATSKAEDSYDINNFSDTKKGYYNNKDDVIDQELPPETTREVALKFMLVIIVILVVASYLADMSKSFMAHAHSYFHN
ncbi:inactive protein RESTRICTED TEV MOVEMENT 2 [Arachis duranensis]|uniref:Inactive protein RESTRICTED TEV MOVEMENT 2 n=1 Tax=Arachis duranensis TaxID=130453 RepID=A0A6P4DR59_ARADU|nr:inactive protein RESTRICTED TEV MOVEMENT 2 [Arachis duranensis]